MKKIAFGLILFLFALCSTAQTTDTIDCDFWWPENGHVHLGVPEYMPGFPGGENALKDYISEHLKYPPLAVEGDITGRVFVGFVVMEDGSLDCFKVIRGLGYGCDEAALEVFKNMPKWMPAMQRGKAISYPYTVPVRFCFDCENKMLEQEIVNSVEEAPEFPDGIEAMEDFIKANLVYPQEAIDAGIEGKVFVSFVVEVDGSVSSIKVLQGIGYGCDEAAMAVVNKMPKWKPAIQRGKPVRYQNYVLVNFSKEDIVEQELMYVVEQTPEYPGGFEAMSDFINANLVYPQEAIDAGIEGRVFVGFWVETDGSLSDIKVLRGIGYGCDEAAMAVVNKMPKWMPAMQKGEPVRMSYMLPIIFKLENEKSE